MAPHNKYARIANVSAMELYVLNSKIGIIPKHTKEIFAVSVNLNFRSHTAGKNKKYRKVGGSMFADSQGIFSQAIG